MGRWRWGEGWGGEHEKSRQVGGRVGGGDGESMREDKRRGRGVGG